ncbi:MAG: hypothetical protein KDI71_15610 [Xanthomonadales bacterium]|nr:hypothetical protein [Xanthomonadales bacterium]
MSLIDRLSKEAQKARQTRELSERERLQREENYQRDLQGRMLALHQYLEQLLAHLKEIQPPIRMNYQLTAYGDLPAQALHEYKLEAERRMLSYEISIRWRARVDHEKCRELKASGHTRVRQLIDQFRALHLGGISDIKQGAGGGDLLQAVFHPKGFIHVGMRATLHAHDPILRLSFENLDTLGTTHKQFPGEEVGDSLFDRIGRFLVREDNELIMEALPDALRQKLRGSDDPVDSMIPPARAYDPMVVVDLDVDFDPDSVPRGKTFGDLDLPAEAPAAASSDRPPRAAEQPAESVPVPAKSKAQREQELLNSASPKAPAPDEERMAQLLAEFESAQRERDLFSDEVLRPDIQPIGTLLFEEDPADAVASANQQPATADRSRESVPAAKANPAPAATPQSRASAAPAPAAAKTASSAGVAQSSTDPRVGESAATRAAAAPEASPASPPESAPTPSAKPRQATSAATASEAKPASGQPAERTATPAAAPKTPASPATAASTETSEATRKSLDLAALELKRREAEAFRDRMRKMAEKLRKDP